ncbi:MAG TPA: hypothetical protein VJ805_04480 [Nitrospiraceae bacterium]|nr:hypothetical protein [Nitrospiraceae bacterium]
MERNVLNGWAPRFMVAAVVSAAVLTAGCFHHPGGIAPSTKPLNPNGYTVLGKVEGRDCVYHIFGLIPVTDGNELKEAVQDAMKKKPYADALTEVTVDAYWQFFILFSRGCTQVYGTAVQSK